MDKLIFNNPWMHLYIKSDGQLFEVGAVTADTDQANAFCEQYPDHGVITTDQNGLHYIASITATK